MEKRITSQEISYYDNGVKEAYVLYTIVGKTLTVTKTYTSDNLRGRGIARMLMDDVMSYARKNGYHVEATCSYAIEYLEKLKDIDDIIDDMIDLDL